ncbi:MAG: MBL fold metallo-hydrolase, partial [Mesorhizobium sp.]|nr:MBL fold metallo-hydrolase [Mesorhizobium sp.]
MTRRPKPANPYYDGPRSDHFDGRLFFNPDGIEPASFTDLLRWQFGGGRAKWPARLPSPHPPAKPEPRIAADGLRVTMVGHATLLVQTAGLNILTDPVWSDRASPLSFAGPRRANAPGIAIADLPPIDVVLLSHNHYDHMDIATLARLRTAHDPVLVTPLGNDRIVHKSIPDMRIAVGDWHDTVDLGHGVTVHFEPAHHWSARGTSDRRMALWSGFTVAAPSGNTYFAGDTGFHEGRYFRAVRDKHGRFRLAILPIGAYEPRWFMAPQHQNPSDAVEAFRILGADHAAGMHWGTFQLTDEPAHEPRDLLHAALDTRALPRERFR